MGWDALRNKKIQTITIDTDIGIPHIHSANGRNIIISGEGEVTGIAAQFVSPGGTDIYARGNVLLYSLQTNNAVHQNITYRVDWFDSQRDHFYQASLPTLFLDNGTTRIHSAEGNIDARGAYFIGAGDIQMTAAKRIMLSVDTLNHQMTEKIKSIGLSIPGMGAWDTYQQGGNIWDISAALDPSLGKANDLFRSGSGAERIANAANLGIDLVNTGNSLMRGIARGNITDELLTRYGLGHDGRFSPTVTLSLTQKKTKTNYQTRGPGGINRGGKGVFKAGEGIDINGMDIHVGGSLEIDTPELRVHGIGLNSTTQQTIRTESLGVTAEGLQSLGFSQGKSQSSSTTYINTMLSAGDNLWLHNGDGKMHLVELDGGVLTGKTLDMDVSNLTIRDHKDTSQTRTQSISVATNGMFSIYQGKGCTRVTQQHSGIHVQEGINTNGHEVIVDETHMIGGKITTDGENHFKTNRLTTEELIDIQQQRGFGFTVDINRMQHVFDGKSTHKPGEQLFNTFKVQLNNKDYVATQVPVIYGEKGTTLQIELQNGPLVTTNNSGTLIQKDDALHIHLDIPITNREILAQAAADIQEGKSAVLNALQSKVSSYQPMNIDLTKPIELIENEAKSEPLLHRQKQKSAPHVADENIRNLETQSNEIHSLSLPENDKVMHLTVTKAQLQTTGKIPKKNKNEIQQGGLTEIGVEILKHIGDGVIDNMAEHGKNLYGSGLMWKLLMNSELAVLDDKINENDKMKFGAMTTLVESGVDFALENIAPPLRGPLTLLEISDIFYNKKRVKEQLHRGGENLREAHSLYRHNHFFSGWLREQEAIHQIVNATRAQTTHKIVSFQHKIATKLVSELNTVFHKVKQEENSQDAEMFNEQTKTSG